MVPSVARFLVNIFKDHTVDKKDLDKRFRAGLSIAAESSGERFRVMECEDSLLAPGRDVSKKRCVPPLLERPSAFMVKRRWLR